jgi:hypothetical protein
MHLVTYDSAGYLMPLIGLPPFHAAPLRICVLTSLSGSHIFSRYCGYRRYNRQGAAPFLLTALHSLRGRGWHRWKGIYTTRHFSSSAEASGLRRICKRSSKCEGAQSIFRASCNVLLSRRTIVSGSFGIAVDRQMMARQWNIGRYRERPFWG